MRNIVKSPSHEWGCYYGGPGSIFLKPAEVDELINDLVLLHQKLAELGMEYSDGKVRLEDLEGSDV